MERLLAWLAARGWDAQSVAFVAAVLVPILLGILAPALYVIWLWR